MKNLILVILTGGVFHVHEVAASNPISMRINNVVHVDMIELNHFYTRQGQHVFDQVIFWERINATGEYRVRGWILTEERESLNRVPYKDLDGMTRVDFKDNGYVSTIKSPLFKESWGFDDPEKKDKTKLDPKYRLALPKHPWGRKIKWPE